jgi:hypothetical protein
MAGVHIPVLLGSLTHLSNYVPQRRQTGRDLLDSRDVFTRYTYARLNLLGFIGVRVGRIATGMERILRSMK